MNFIIVRYLCFLLTVACTSKRSSGSPCFLVTLTHPSHVDLFWVPELHQQDLCAASAVEEIICQSRR